MLQIAVKKNRVFHSSLQTGSEAWHCAGNVEKFQLFSNIVRTITPLATYLIKNLA